MARDVLAEAGGGRAAGHRAGGGGRRPGQPGRARGLDAPSARSRARRRPVGHGAAGAAPGERAGRAHRRAHAGGGGRRHLGHPPGRRPTAASALWYCWAPIRWPTSPMPGWRAGRWPALASSSRSTPTSPLLPARPTCCCLRPPSPRRRGRPPIWKAGSPRSARRSPPPGQPGRTGSSPPTWPTALGTDLGVATDRGPARPARRHRPRVRPGLDRGAQPRAATACSSPLRPAALARWRRSTGAIGPQLVRPAAGREPHAVRRRRHGVRVAVARAAGAEGRLHVHPLDLDRLGATTGTSLKVSSARATQRARGRGRRPGAAWRGVAGRSTSPARTGDRPVRLRRPVVVDLRVENL